MSIPESEIEIEPSLESSNSSIGKSSATCWECMADYFSRAWDSIRNGYFIAQDWILDVCTCTSCYDTNEETPYPPVKNVQPRWISTRGSNSKIKISQIQSRLSQMAPSTQTQQSPPEITVAQQNPSDSPPPGRTIVPQVSPGIQPSVSATVRSSVSSPSVTSNNAKATFELAKETPPLKVIEPPKIDFIETGSIFGDRKRIGSEHNLQMENGRFRSPGMSKTIMGPNGRPIRVSFVTGFPVIKSVESTRSIISKNYKKSNETIQIQPQQEKGSLEKMRKIPSNKSTKSLLSATDNDNIGKTLGSSTDDNTNK